MNEVDWRIAPIPEEPEKTLDAWSVWEVSRGFAPGAYTLHVAGFAREGCKVRVSTAILTLDPASRRCRTQSGRVYCLDGRPGLSTDVLAVWGAFKRANRITAERDVTAEVDNLLAVSSQLATATPGLSSVGSSSAATLTEPKVPSVVSVALARLTGTASRIATAERDSPEDWGSLFDADSGEAF